MNRVCCVAVVAVVAIFLSFAEGSQTYDPRLETMAPDLIRLAVKCIPQEYPNNPAHSMNNDADAKTPKVLHPSFFGCYDWHSSVHNHWLLVRLMRLMPGRPEERQMRETLANSLTASNLRTELDYFYQRTNFERPYGWTWLLKLAAELRDWNDIQGNEWLANMQPLTTLIADKWEAFLPNQTYAIRVGTHPNTAFSLRLSLSYASSFRDEILGARLIETSTRYYAKDSDLPARFEPGGEEFVSPALAEAILMQQILPVEEFQSWLQTALPTLRDGKPASLFQPVEVANRLDYKIVHLDGLNLYRAFAFRSLALGLPKSDPLRSVCEQAAQLHAEYSLPWVASGDYGGEHWLPTFATMFLSLPIPDTR
eukprot:TRINITY_DN3219_c0_g1_i1.p1 TRINITY_DN3219_c0_g1~~TRINITY_DN3219_c0_g1_i1.p1  ORF type:complete len:367 (+),score=77.32 TRINITY_DN3219_c0_g1_i1:45-1145(+)